MLCSLIPKQFSRVHHALLQHFWTSSTLFSGNSETNEELKYDQSKLSGIVNLSNYMKLEIDHGAMPYHHIGMSFGWIAKNCM